MCYKLVITMSFLTLMGSVFFFFKEYMLESVGIRKEKAESDPAYLRLYP